MRNALALLAAASISTFAACSSGSAAGSIPAAADARISTAAGPVTLHVRVADTDAERERGLMGVKDLAADGGMAFLFDGPTRASFWMKDTPTPLSIAFWGSDGRIVSLMDMPPCTADPCPTYRPGSPFVGALEAHEGFFAGHGVEVGDRVAIVR
ncbi:MAG TPA: DUF192 domain-containing protein [Actinomycetota bacterium]|nr:DUF192 domain-containing protein [Actinomycetota bacterium]